MTVSGTGIFRHTFGNVSGTLTRTLSTNLASVAYLFISFSLSLSLSLTQTEPFTVCFPSTGHTVVVHLLYFAHLPIVIASSIVSLCLCSFQLAICFDQAWCVPSLRDGHPRRLAKSANLAVLVGGSLCLLNVSRASRFW